MSEKQRPTGPRHERRVLPDASSAPFFCSPVCSRDSGLRAAAGERGAKCDGRAQRAKRRWKTRSRIVAKQLANPVASLISVPFQFNYDQGLNRLDTGKRVTLNIQPVIPISLTPDWNLISRTILPLNWSDDALVDSGQIFGTGDTVQSLFLSPAKPWNGIIWGVGPDRSCCRPEAAKSIRFISGARVRRRWF